MSANGYTKEQVIEALHDIAGEMHNKMLKGEPPTMTLPVRTKPVSYTHLRAHETPEHLGWRVVL